MFYAKSVVDVPLFFKFEFVISLLKINTGIHLYKRGGKAFWLKAKNLSVLNYSEVEVLKLIPFFTSSINTSYTSS